MYIRALKPAKNRLKTPNKSIFKPNTSGTKQTSRQTAGRKAGNTRPEDHRQHPAGPEASKACKPAQVGTPQSRQKATTCPHLFATPQTQIYIYFCRFLSPKIPRKHQSKQEKIHFCPFLPKICPDSLKICHKWSRKGRRKGAAGSSREQPGSTQKKDTPPLLPERKECLAPIIFRTKNTAKSRLGGLEKISEKICGKMFRGKRKAPNLAERGRGVLKYERLIYESKDS